MADGEKKLVSIQKIPRSFCRDLKVLFTDIDGTVTFNGMIIPPSYTAMWKLYQKKINVVPVTGRPAGWCDHIARMWPVKGIIGENGAFFFSYDHESKKMLRVFLISEEEMAEAHKKLEKIKEKVLKEVPGSGISADQSFRIADLAIDYCEDVNPLKKQDLQKICSIVANHGASWKVSNIHVNCWYGTYDKLTGVEKFLKHFFGEGMRELQSKITFIGDSHNDEPLFASFKTSIAVSNIKDFLDNLEHLPVYVTENGSAYGFSEAVEVILRKRSS